MSSPKSNHNHSSVLVLQEHPSYSITLPRARLFDLRYRGLNLAVINGDYASFSLPLHLQQVCSEDNNHNNNNAEDGASSSQQVSPLVGSSKNHKDTAEHDSIARHMPSSSSSHHQDPFSPSNNIMGAKSHSSPLSSSSLHYHHQSSSSRRNQQQAVAYPPQQPDECVKRLAKNLHVSHLLRGHAGCINSIEFNDAATTLVTASDDTCLNLYSAADNDWTRLTPGGVSTAHTRNIFNAVFIPGSNDRHVVSCGLDGNVVLTVLDDGRNSSSSSSSSSIVFESDYMCSNVEISPFDPNVLYVSRGSGGVVVLDIRNKRQIGDFSVSTSINARPCNGLACHPHHPHVLAVGSDSPIIYLCDTRMLPGYHSSRSNNSTTQQLDGNAAFLSICNRQAAASADGVGGLNFSDRGDKIVVSYKGGEVVSYDWTVALPASNRRKISSETTNGIGLSFDFNTCKYAQVTEVPAKVYVGRQNNVTMFKEAVFLADDRLIASGGDCGHVFFWDAQTCKLLTKVRGDSDVVNGVLAHPYLPVVVACGIDSHARVISASEKVDEKIWNNTKNNNRKISNNNNNNNANRIQAEGDDEVQQGADEGVNPRSLFRLRARLMRQLLGLAGGRFDEDDADDNDEDSGSDQEEQEGGGDAEFNTWGAHGDDDDDEEDNEEDYLRRGQQEYTEQQNEQLRELILTTVIEMRRDDRPARGTLAQLGQYFKLKARSLRLLIQDANRAINDDESSMDEEELEAELAARTRVLGETSSDDDDEVDEEEENADNDDDDDDDDETIPTATTVTRTTSQEKSSRARSSAVDSASTNKNDDDDDDDDDHAPLPKIKVDSAPFMPKSELRKSISIQEVGEDEAVSGDFDRHVEDDEDEDDEDHVKDFLKQDGDDEEEDEEEEDTDDGLMQQLLDSVQDSLDLAKAIVGKCQRAGILSDDPASPTIFRRRPVAATTTAATTGIPPPPPPQIHPLIELAAAIADVNYLALTEKNRLANLSGGMRQAFLVPWLRALAQRAMLLAATGSYDEAVDHAMEMLSIDDTRTDAIGIATGIARVRLQLGQPEPESYLEELIEYCRAITRSRMSSLVARRQANRLERSLTTMIDGGRLVRVAQAAKEREALEGNSESVVQNERKNDDDDDDDEEI